ncbi:MAG: septum formation initiator family protein [Cyanobacteriota bacterium]
METKSEKNENNKNVFSKEELSVLVGKNNTQKLVKKLGLINIICLFSIAFLLMNILYTINVDLHLVEQSTLLKKENVQVMIEQKKLKKDINFYKKQEGIEKLARESLGLIKSDEIPVKYIDSQKKN